jgi:hypothetical protein
LPYRTNVARRIPRHNRASRYITCYDAARTHHAGLADGYPFQDQAVHADKHVIPNVYRRVFPRINIHRPAFRREGVKISIGQGNVGADEHTIAKHDFLCCHDSGAGEAVTVKDVSDSARKVAVISMD